MENSAMLSDIRDVNRPIHTVLASLHAGDVILNKHLSEFMVCALSRQADDTIVPILLAQQQGIPSTIRVNIAMQALLIQRLATAAMLLQGIDLRSLHAGISS
jgi:hypothetical protein